MPKSFLFTNKRFTAYKQQYGSGTIDNSFEGVSKQESTHNTNQNETVNIINEEHNVMHVPLLQTDETWETSNYNSNANSNTVRTEVTRKEYTLPIIKQKERFRTFETTQFSSTPQQAHYSFETNCDTYENRQDDRHQRTISENFFKQTKQYDVSDGESDSGISLISDDSRHGYSPKSDYAYHCSEHLSLLFDFFSPRKPVVRETVVEEHQEVRRALDFSMPNYQTSTLSNTESQDQKAQFIETEEMFACADCGKRYSTSSNLARHRQTHRSSADKKARQCPHCDKVYVSMPAFSMHVRTHNQGCECPYCGKKFSRPWLLQGHIRTHTGEKPFSCPQCSKCFADKSNLRAHVQTHSTEKPYECGRCGKAFALKSYLYKHEESSCMRGQRSVHKRTRKGIALQEPTTVMFVDEHERNSW
ncbi:uncharacterized protein LOC143079679 [Mytilus galloprovincialis]|uniref:uncharacterized protein LOC143079679 n=1 Tax=Mytilus galloprovincialis TaxID=29158 RepID=UPI003F7B4C43